MIDRRKTSTPFSASTIERKLRLAEEAAGSRPPSLLEEMFAQIEADGRWFVSFSDLCGLAERVPDLHLAVVYQLHGCRFCAMAKGDGVGLGDCVKNKRAVNRAGLRRREGFFGQCHLGVTDLVEPLILGEQVMGLFFLGSVVEIESESASEARLRRSCERRHRDVAAWLTEWRKLPRVSRAEIEVMRGRLKLMARIAARLAEAAGHPTGLERPGRSGAIWEKGRRVPAVLGRALAFVLAHYQESIRLRGLAETLGVRPDYLGSLFREHTHGTLSDHVARVRIRHACRLLGTGRYSAGEVAVQVGFTDQANFNKVFKRETGLTPGGFARAFLA